MSAEEVVTWRCARSAAPGDQLAVSVGRSEPIRYGLAGKADHGPQLGVRCAGAAEHSEGLVDRDNVDGEVVEHRWIDVRIVERGPDPRVLEVEQTADVRGAVGS